MTDDLKSMMDDLLSTGNLQPKIDILESNITGSLEAGKDDIDARVSIRREGTAAVTEILDKAIKQFFAYFNIPDSIVNANILNALEQTDETRLKFTVNDDPTSDKQRNIEVTVTPQKVDILIEGYPSIPSTDETIVEYYFEHEHYPGKILPNGKFDYRELHKFPAVKKDDNVLFVCNPVSGKNGMTYSGNPVIVKPPSDLNLNIKSGLIKERGYHEKSQMNGYYLKAATDGVILITKTNNKITDIDVSSEVKLDKIDFSTGNIGSEFKSPVSMEIGEIGNEFKVSVDGRLKADNVNGGIISTNDNAITVNVRDNSKVTAKKNIQSKIVTDSYMESEDGMILIEGEVRDSRLKAPVTQFICNKGQMLNNTIESNEITFQGGYYCGTNKIYLGNVYFQKRLDLIDRKEAFEQTKEKVSAAIGDIKSSVLPALKDLATQITNEKMMDQYRLLIRHFQSLEFNATNEILSELRKSLNVMKIDSLKKSFTNLNALAIKQIDVDAQIKSAEKDLELIENNINKIKFYINGVINATASIKIYCNKKLEMNEPVYEIRAANKDQNEKIDISGYYNLKEGFVIS